MMSENPLRELKKKLPPRSFLIKSGLFIILISTLVLFPTFKLALTGDDFLGLWRYEKTIGYERYGGSNFKYFFSDYGPQDLITVLIHHFFGFRAYYYYLFSYLLRTLAAVSVLPAVYFLTKSKKAAFFSALFFTVGAVGIEATSWSFNMPSYLAISIFNLFLIPFFSALGSKSLKFLLLNTFSIVLLIVIQPIRMTFLPIWIVFTVIFWTVYFRKIELFKWSLVKILFAFMSFVLIISFTNIGEIIGIPVTKNIRHTGKWIVQKTTTLDKVKSNLKDRNFTIFLTPIGQFGAIVTPNTYIPRRVELMRGPELLKFLFPIALVFAVYLLLLNKYFVRSKKTGFYFFPIMSFLWLLIVWQLFANTARFEKTSSDIISYISGGYFLIFLSFLLCSRSVTRQSRFYATSILSFIILSLLGSVLLNPTFLQQSENRYLITGANGMAILLGLVLSTSKNKIIVVSPLILLLVFNVLVSHKYLSYLGIVREYNLTEHIRKSIKVNDNLVTNKEAMIYYFEADKPDMLYHSLMFGFPMFIHYYQGSVNPWNVAYTDNWQELVNSYLDGSGLKRFGTLKIEPVKLENIYSYKLDWGNLIDTSEDTRYRLLEIKRVKNKNTAGQ